MADAPVETTRPTPPETLKPNKKEVTRHETVRAFRESVKFMGAVTDLNPKEQEQLKEIQDTVQRMSGSEYEVVQFENQIGQQFRTHERIPTQGLLAFLDRKIKSGTLDPLELDRCEEFLEILATRSRPYNRDKRLEPEQKVARVVHQARLKKESDGPITRKEYVEAARDLDDRLELILPRKLPPEVADDMQASGVDPVDVITDLTTPPGPDEEPISAPTGGVHAPSRHRAPDTIATDESSGDLPESPEEIPNTPESKTPEDLKREILVVNREDDFFKRAREVADTHLQEVLRGEGEGGAAKRFFKRIKYRMAEEYYRQKFTQQAYKAMVESGNPYLQMELVKNTLKVSSAAHGAESSHKAGVDTASRLKTDGAYETEKVSDEVQGPLRDELITRLVRPIFNGEITERAQVQEILKAFVQAHKDDPAVKEFFGSDTTQMGKIAENFATDLLEMGQGLKADFETHGFAVDHLDQAVSLRFATAEWGALQKRAVGKEELSRTDRMVRWCQKRRLTGAIFNPAVIGATSSLATFAILRAPGRALGIAGHIATPGVGMLTGGAFGAFRRNYDLKVDRAMHNVERAYGGRIGPDSKRRERMEQFRYQTISAQELLNGRVGDEPLKSMRELANQDLSVEDNRRALIQRLAEIEGREDFSVREKIDLITFGSREGVEGERLQLARAKAEARVKLRESGLTDHQIQTMRDDLITEALKPRFEQDQAQKDRAFKVHRVKESVKAGAFGAAAGLGVGFAAHEVTTEVLHKVGVGGGSYTSEALGKHRRNLNPDSLLQIRQRGGTITVDNDITLRFDPVKHTGELLNTKTGQELPVDLKINPNGHIRVKGELPPGLQEKLHEGGFDIDKGPLVDGTKTIHNNGEILDSAIGHQTKIPKGTEWLQDPANPGKWNLVEKGHSGNILIHDAQFDGSGRLLGYDTVGSKAQVNVSEVVTQKEFATGETAAAELDKYGTNVAHREWYAYNTPVSERNELTAYNSIFDAGNGQKGVVWDMSQMQLGYQSNLNPNPIDVQQVIASHQAGFAFSAPGHEGTPVWVSDGADGVWDGKVTLNPNDFTHHIDPNNPNSLTLGEFSQKILNQGALNQAVEQNLAEGRDPSYLASELTQRQNVFNLGLNGKMGYIEAGRMLPNADGSSTFQVFATGRGATDVQFEVIKEVQTTFNLTQEVGVKLPTYNLFAADSEIFPIIPFPFVPRRPLERLLFMYGYGGTYSQGNLGLLDWDREFPARRSPRLNANPRAHLDESEEIHWYLDQQSPAYRKELDEMNVGAQPMSDECRVVITIPAYGEGKVIKKTLELISNQKDKDGNPLNPNLYEVVILDNHPGGAQSDNTKQEVEAFLEAHPEMRVVFAHKEWGAGEPAAVGNARKYAADLALLRDSQRASSTGDLIIVSNDADLDGISDRYVVDMISAFDSNPELDAVAGKFNLPDEALAKPNLRAAQRLWYTLDRVISRDAEGDPSGRSMRPPGLVGRNAAFRASTYAGIGGYNPKAKLAEDLEIGWMIEMARNWDAGRTGYINGAEVVSNPRRFIAAAAQGTPLIHMYGGFNENPEIRTLDNKEILKRIPDTFDVKSFEKEAEALWQAGTVEGGQYAHLDARFEDLFKRTMDLMGAQYQIVDGHVKITDATKLIEGLKEQPTDSARSRPETSRETGVGAVESLPAPTSDSENAETSERMPGEEAVLSAPETAVGERPKSLAQVLHDQLSAETSANSSFELQGGAVIDFFESELSARGAHLQGGTYEMNGDQISFSGKVQARGGVSNFDLTLHVNPAGKLTVASHDLDAIGTHRVFKGRIEQYITNLPSHILSQINARIPSDWKVSGFEIVDGKLNLKFAKKGRLLDPSTAVTDMQVGDRVILAGVEQTLVHDPVRGNRLVPSNSLEG